MLYILYHYVSVIQCHTVDSTILGSYITVGNNKDVVLALRKLITQWGR